MRWWVQPDELASGRETSSSQDDEDDEDNMSVIGASKSFTATYQRQFSERDGDYFYDAVEPRKGPSRAPDAPEQPGAAPAKPSPLRSLDTVAPAVLASASSPQAAVASAPSWVDTEASVQRRLALPEPKETQKSVSLWSIIKECIGKDLTRICLPVYFNEPLSALQKMVEEVEYSHLLDKAASCPKGSMQRLAWLAVFAISG